MDYSYGVHWCEHGVEQAGRLAVGPHSLELRPFDDLAEPREIRFDEIEWVEIRPAEHDGQRESVVVKTRAGDEIRIDSVVGRWILRDLTGQVFEDAYARHEAAREWHPGLGF
jgi:hypothetical protein